MARPKRTNTIRVRMSDQEARQLTKLANHYQVSMSEVLRALLHRAIEDPWTLDKLSGFSAFRNHRDFSAFRNRRDDEDDEVE